MNTVFQRLLIIVALLFAQDEALATRIPEFEMKAAYLYNFLLYTEWQNKPTNTIRICHLGKDRFDGALDKLTQKTVKGLPVTLSYLSKYEDAAQCQAIFIDSIENGNYTEILSNFEHQGILTMTDQAELFEHGAMVGLFIDGNRLVFDVNFYMLKNGKLAIGAPLLRLARNIIR